MSGERSYVLDLSKWEASLAATAPKFRKGDVLSWKGEEWRIDGVGALPGFTDRWTITPTTHNRHSWHPEVGADLVAAGAALLRRPVVVGDLLSWSVDVNYNAPHARYFKATAEHAASPSLATLATHADGTRIEPPQLVPPPFEPDEHVFRESRADDPGPTFTLRGWAEPWSPDETDRQRASKLADECGTLRDENRSLLVENAQLRRQVERLERKAKR